MNDSSNFWQRFKKILGKRLCSKISLRRENECTHFRAANRLLLRDTVADAFVSCNHNPVVLSSERQPFWIGSILREMLIVNFDFEISASKNAGHFVAAELPIEKED